MANDLRQFLNSFLLRIIRLLVRVKPIVLWTLRKTFQPFRFLGRVFLYQIVVPCYRIAFFIRRNVRRVDRPAKNRMMFFVTNRQAIHAVLASLVILMVVLNVTTDSVRAETFGQTSLLYQIVSDEGTELIEEYATEEDIGQLVNVHYQDQNALSAYARGVDTTGSADLSALLVGGGSLVSVPISEASDSVAPRDSVETYTVQSGDTLSIIAEKFGITLNTLLWANSLTVRSVIRPGSTLKILPVTGVSHTVKSGDTLTRIASKYKADAAQILAYNKLASANDLTVGETLIIPGGEIIYVAPVKTTPTISQIISPSGSSNAVATAAGMIWPSDLHIITQYYSWVHNGLDVDCGYTNQNYAAADGIVTKSGWYSGYGYLVEITHDNGIVTRYGHHKSLFVSAGQSISQGQPLGVCGTTGRSTGTHLHFEVRVNGATTNPLSYIR
ncbi:MAG: peptidoglycan DD-metalloendopeptidase family protein [Patescibacteria group bacterium]